MKRISFELEFFFKSSVSMVFEYVSTSEGLSMWFCDSVMEVDDKFEFFWEGNSENAILTEYVHDEKVVFKWEDAANQSEFLEFKVFKSPITNDTILTVKEFCDEDELDDVTELWNSQISELRSILGN